VNAIQIFGEIIFIGETDPDNIVRFKIDIQFNELTVQGIKHKTVVVIDHGIDKLALSPYDIGAFRQGEPVEFSFVHANNFSSGRKKVIPGIGRSREIENGD
jgi:hypothetical protein